MNIEYPYIQKRAYFGRPYIFISDGPTIVDHVEQKKALAENYIIKTPVDKGTQETVKLSVHEVNTWRPDFTDRGINHDQGGWPKELNISDEEAVLRFKKKLEREENYIASMKELSKSIEHAVKQNNAVNIYQKYFEGALIQHSVAESVSQIRSVFRDKSEIKRPVSHLSWSPEKGAFATSYCNMHFQVKGTYESSDACIWDVEVPSAPQTIFDSKIPIVSLEWNPSDHHILIAGMYNGRIAFYDVRKAPEHVEISTEEVSHRDPVHSVVWISSKTGVDFFSTSGDGVVKWWDCRNLSTVLDSIILDPSKNQSMSQAHGASCLEYDPSIPAKYLVGTENGYVICGNRKGTNVSEKLPWMMKAHSGPLYALQRNASVSKVYLTVGDWSARLWSEECKESAIMWTKPYKVNLTGGEWSKSRYSVFFITRSDGYLDCWDLLQNQTQPYVSSRISPDPLTTLRVEEQGQIVVVGDEAGKTYLIQYSEGLSSCQKNDKTVLSTIFDRESRREKILESRMKELRLAMKLKAAHAEGSIAESKTELVDNRQGDIEKAEENYWEEVNNAIKALKEVVKKEEDDKEEEEEEEEEGKSGAVYEKEVYRQSIVRLL